MPSQGWRNVLLLALVSLVADISGEMLMAVLPFLLLAQGATGVGVALVSGITEGVGHFMKLVGGRLGERVKHPRLLIGGGYLLAALSRFGVGLAPAWGVTLAFRSLDRVGKGLRTAPRDALVAAGIEPQQRSRAFGLHRAADTTGAVVGVLVVLAALAWLDASHRSIVLVGAAVGLLTVIPLFFVRDAPLAPSSEGRFQPGPAQPGYRSLLAVMAAFNLGRVSYMFYLIHAAGRNIEAVQQAVLWYLLFNIVYAAASYPLGRLADLRGRRVVVLCGFLLQAAAAVPFILGQQGLPMAAGFVLLGLSFAAVESNAVALAAELSGQKGRSRRLGEYHALVGAATLVGSLVAGVLWDEVARSWTFGWSLVLSCGAAAGLALMLARGVGKRDWAAAAPGR